MISLNPPVSEFVATRGTRLHVRRWGSPDAPMLFMLHGWMDISASFQFVVDALAGDWQVIAPDARIPFQPWSRALTEERADGARGKDDPAAHCVPGMPKLLVLPWALNDPTDPARPFPGLPFKFTPNPTLALTPSTIQ